MIPSTISITTSFIAAYLTFRRSPYFALAYASNDIVLIVLWVLASFKDISYISVVICFAVFLFNDLYGFYNWQRLEKTQKAE
jgi:nicotinamide riboside transporter PnuC